MQSKTHFPTKLFIFSILLHSILQLTYAKDKLLNSLQKETKKETKKTLLSKFPSFRIVISKIECKTYFPTKLSRTLDFPALCPPTTAIWGSSRPRFCPVTAKISCNLLIVLMISFIPSFVVILNLNFQTVCSKFSSVKRCF